MSATVRRRGVVATANVQDVYAVALGACTASPIELGDQKGHGTKRVSTIQSPRATIATQPALSGKSMRAANKNHKSRSSLYLLEMLSIGAVAMALSPETHSQRPLLHYHPSQVLPPRDH